MVADGNKRTLPHGIDPFVFRWKPLGYPWWPKAVALFGAGFLMTMIVGSFRIRMSSATTGPMNQGTLTYAADDEVGRHLAQLAREGGPFPSRFDPAEWNGAESTEQAVFQATEWSPPAYIQELARLPAEKPAAMPLVSPRMQPIRAPRSSSPITESVVIPLVLKPRIHPLAGLSFDELPSDLPDFGDVDPLMASEAWRFLLYIDDNGRIQECISLTGGDEEGTKRGERIATWLRGVSFPLPETEIPRWFSVGVGFANSPAIHGPDAR